MGAATQLSIWYLLMGVNYRKLFLLHIVTKLKSHSAVLVSWIRIRNERNSRIRIRKK